MPVKVLVFGASGLLMAHLLPHLLETYDFEITAFARPGSKGIPFLKKIGVSIIEGNWDDSELIRRTVGAFDLVWDAGDSHDRALPALLVPILKAEAKHITFVRFTGTGNWITQTGGNADASAKTYDDSVAGDIGSIHDEMFNGAGDKIALDALKEGLNVWLLCTGGVYGPRPAGIVSAGVFVRLYTNNALQLGYTPYIGDGGAQMQLIHLDDVQTATDLFLSQVLPTVGKPLEGTATPHTRFYNAPGYSVKWRTIADVWSKVFADLHKDIPVKNVPMEEAGFVAPLINAEMKSKATHLGRLGWKPQGPTIEEALPAILSLSIGTELPLP